MEELHFFFNFFTNANPSTLLLKTSERTVVFSLLWFGHSEKKSCKIHQKILWVENPSEFWWILTKFCENSTKFAWIFNSQIFLVNFTWFFFWVIYWFFIDLCMSIKTSKCQLIFFLYSTFQDHFLFIIKPKVIKLSIITITILI
jgi:hypothetical protein